MERYISLEMTGIEIEMIHGTLKILKKGIKSIVYNKETKKKRSQCDLKYKSYFSFLRKVCAEVQL